VARIRKKSEGKRPLGGPRHKMRDGIKMYLQEIGWMGFVWIVLFEDII